MTDITTTLRTIADYIRYATSAFTRAGLHFHQGFDSALDEASFLVLHTLALPHDMPPAYANTALMPDERAQILENIQRRLAGEPLAYITGEAWFAGRAYQVSPAVLIPRSPIAELIEQGFQPWLEESPERILDLCTGSGCIGIACAIQFPDAQVDLADISPEALAIAEKNAANHGVDARARIVQSDVFAALQGKKYDLIVTNPPYISAADMLQLTAELQREPTLALASGVDGLDIPLLILDEASSYLTADGLLVLEVGQSESALLAVLPDLPGDWVDFQRGGSGVVVIRAADLRQYRPYIRRALAERTQES
jgi:ribosomal protein L3 glutamine methyltransferase